MFCRLFAVLLFSDRPPSFVILFLRLRSPVRAIRFVRTISAAFFFLPHLFHLFSRLTLLIAFDRDIKWRNRCPYSEQNGAYAIDGKTRIRVKETR